MKTHHAAKLKIIFSLGLLILVGCSLSALIEGGQLNAEVSKYANLENYQNFPLKVYCVNGVKSVELEVRPEKQTSANYSTLSSNLDCAEKTMAKGVDLSSLPEGPTQARMTPNAGEGKTLSFIIDRTPPTGSIAGSVASVVYQGNVADYVITGTCSDAGQPMRFTTESVTVNGACGNNTYSQSLNLSSLSQGYHDLQVTLWDEAGNKTDLTKHFRLDTLAPTGLAFTGLPADPSPEFLLNIGVIGTDAVQYLYKLGPASTTDCHSSTGYSSAQPISQLITDNISAQPNGLMRICAVAVDSDGNTTSLSNALSAEWHKDSTLALAIIGPYSPAGNPSNSTVSRTVSISGVALDQYKAVMTKNQVCTGIDWSTVTATSIATPFVVNIGGDGVYRVCALGHNTSGYWQNESAPSSSVPLVIDQMPPQLILSSNATAYSNIATHTVMADFSEPVTGFTLSDLSLSNASVADFTVNSDSQAQFSLTALTEGMVSVNVGLSAYADPSGNTNTTASSLSFVYDITPPSVVLSSTTPEPTNTASMTVDIQFSEIVTDFDVSKIQISGGTVTLLTGIGSHYTANVLASGSSLTMEIPAGSAHDQATNASLASNVFSRSIDTTPPSTPTLLAFGTDSTTPSFTFSSTDAESGIAGYECSYGGGAYASCGSGISYNNQNATAGLTTTFSVRARNAAGSTSATSSVTWTNGAFTSFSACSVSCGGGTQSRTCTNPLPSVSPPGLACAGVTSQSCNTFSCTCNLPWGGTIANGASVTAYASSAPAGSCSSYAETRTCTNGVLSGSYTNQTCSNGCTGTPWGNVSNGFSGTAYSTTSPTGSCSSYAQTRTCTNGVMSGSYSNSTCYNGCTGTPWGNVSHGFSGTAYSTSSVACGGSCSSYSQTRYCSNGTLTGSYSTTSCSVASCGSSCPSMAADQWTILGFQKPDSTYFSTQPNAAACLAWCNSVPNTKCCNFTGGGLYWCHRWDDASCQSPPYWQYGSPGSNHYSAKCP